MTKRNNDDSIPGQTGRPENNTGQIRFGIKHLFYSIALVASGLVVLGPASIAVSLVVMGFWAFTYQSRSKKISPLGCLFAVFAAMLFFALLMPAVSQVRESARRTQCMNNMRQLMLACLNYEYLILLGLPGYFLWRRSSRIR